MIGRTVREVFPELEHPGIHELLDSVYATGTPFLSDSLRLQMRRGADAPLEDVYFKFVYQPLPNAAGGFEGIAVLATDVTEVAGARRDAEAANRAKDEFLAMLGHELRNPLAPILTALQLMSLRDGADATHKERAVIDRQVRHLVRLVDDLLDVSRIARGKIELARVNVELSSIVAQAVEMASPLLEECCRGLLLACRTGLLVNGDVTRLSQVVRTLTNAASYTGRAAASKRKDPPWRHDRLHVRDNGIGISPRCCRRSSTCSCRAARRSTGRRAGRSGLTIVRTMVGAWRGVEAQSGPGRGSAL